MKEEDRLVCFPVCVRFNKNLQLLQQAFFSSHGFNIVYLPHLNRDTLYIYITLYCLSFSAYSDGLDYTDTSFWLMIDNS